jgi:Glycosyltransferase family 87
LMIVPFIWQRRWKALAACLAVVLIATLLPDLLVANPDHTLWVRSWYDKFLSHIDAANAPQVSGAWTSWNMLNQSLSGTLYRLGTHVDDATEMRWNAALVSLSPRSIALITAAVKVFVLALVSYAVWPTHFRHESPRSKAYLTALQGSAVLLGMLLLSPMSSKQHFCVLIVPISVLVIDWLYFERSPTVGFAIAILFVFGTLAGKDLVGTNAHKQLGAYGSLTWLTLISLIAICDVARRVSARWAHMSVLQLHSPLTPPVQALKQSA